MSNLAEQIREALSMFARNSTEPALIGGLAVVAHQVVRATRMWIFWWRPKRRTKSMTRCWF